MHPNNPHHGRYDLEALCKVIPALSKYIKLNPNGQQTIDFHNPIAVKALNKAILKKDYNISHWDIPQGYLCPPIPGRADYIHHLSDLLLTTEDRQIRILDIGTGANVIYPLLGHCTFGWSFVGSDIDLDAVKNANSIIQKNNLSGNILIRTQINPNHFFKNIIQDGEYFDAVICNPPFHSSAKEAQSHNRRKSNNLKNKRTDLNFGGQSNELWYEGGEINFISKMVAESKSFSKSVGWFTSLVSKAAHIPKLKKIISKVKPSDYRIIEMSQGQKQSRMMAWRY